MLSIVSTSVKSVNCRFQGSKYHMSGHYLQFQDRVPAAQCECCPFSNLGGMSWISDRNSNESSP